MKKSLVIGLLGLAITINHSFGQGTIILDNYNSGGPNLLYGPGSGGPAGTPIAPGGNWTVGLYFAPGSVLGAPAGFDVPGGPFQLGAGPGSSSLIAGPSTGGTLGQFLAGSAFLIDPAGPLGGATFTILITAYNGADYASSGLRGHSAAFTMTTSASSSPTPNQVGAAPGFLSFQVVPIPEPSTFALAGLGAAAMLIIRRRK